MAEQERKKDWQNFYNYGVEISAEKTKLIYFFLNSGINTNINGQKFETVRNFKYVVSVITD